MPDNVQSTPELDSVQAADVNNTIAGNEAAGIAAQAADLIELRRELARVQLRRGQTPAGLLLQHEQKQAKLALAEVKGQVAVAGTLAAIADQIGFQSCPLLPHQLRGALLEILAKAKNPSDVARYEQHDKDFLASKRRKPIGVFGFVTAAQLGAELQQKARSHGLRHNVGAGGFEGRIALPLLLALGQDYNATVSVVIGKQRHVLVNAGEVARDVLELIGGAAGSEATIPMGVAVHDQQSPVGLSDQADETSANMVFNANPVPIEPVEVAPDDAVVETESEKKEINRPAMPYQRPMGGRKHGM